MGIVTEMFDGYYIPRARSESYITHLVLRLFLLFP